MFIKNNFTMDPAKNVIRITLVCRCEVSGEGPIFPTDSKFGDMLVVVVPNLGPRIIGAKSRYTH